MKTLKVTLYAAMVAALFAGCKGDTGPVGPAGTNGNANVTPSGGLSVENWNYDGTNDDWWTSFTVSTSEPGGIVEVFLSSDNGNSWNAIPLTFVSQPVDAYWTYNYTTGTNMVVTVYFQWNDLGSHNNPYVAYGNVTLQFNVVYIAPSVIRQNPNTNLKNYSEVSKIPGVTFSKNVQ